MKKFLFAVVGCVLGFSGVAWGDDGSGFEVGCKPTRCDVSMGNDRLNADTLENTGAARRAAASCYICEEGYCEDGDIVWTKDLSRFMVCRHSYGWGDDKWHNYEPTYCADETNLTVDFDRGGTGLAKYWKLNGHGYTEQEMLGNNARGMVTGQNVCYYYACPDGLRFDVEQIKCVSSLGQVDDDAGQRDDDDGNGENSGGGNARNDTFECVDRCKGMSGQQYAECTTCCLVPASYADWVNGECRCVENPSYDFNVLTQKCEPEQEEESGEQDNDPAYQCDQQKIQMLWQLSVQYGGNQEIVTRINQIFTYCAGAPVEAVFNTMISQLNVIVDQTEKDNDAVEQQSLARSRIESAAKTLQGIESGLRVSAWRNDEGKFNTSRLLSDSIAGVVLGTAGGLITSNVVKKNQVEDGFEDLQCTVGGQVVASWGDEFRVGIQ
ncbi:MAG: hypothetical protein IAC77_00770 [Proteobacteria bacterium]|uniref:Uncharacterized protein n=1 Tax=Candidatus Enterousia excrementavium TaxID=2840789 RepID=A0A940DD08_9PROT|nr:hypothetical protein [Candidatus Enterousia excrementavium]